MKLLKTLGLFFVGLLLSHATFAQNFSPDIVVDINGTGDFTSLQAAFDAASPGTLATPTIIYVKRGLYEEKLLLPANKIHITLIGESREETIISYGIYNCSTGTVKADLCPDAKVAPYAGNTDLLRTAATLTVMANDFRAENITIQNNAPILGQAQAITLQADRNVFVNCDILAYQDTIYFWMAETSRAYFKGCVIEGRTDYIYGRGVGFFGQCEIRSFGGGWITAPSSTINQTYGFVFYECDLTYKTPSPRAGDDGALVRFGRPWHEYPKVAWLYCTMTDKIHPEGWGDKWNMTYSDTSTDLHLYEWMNTGAGANMSGRANWAGLRAMVNQAEADLYEPEIVLEGSDNWDPTAIAPTVTVYNWDGGAGNNGWLEANNWNPDGVPAASEVANVDGSVTLDANGGSFVADLNLVNGATLDVSSNSSVTLLTLNQSTLSSSANASFSGTIKTKGDVSIDASNNLNITAAIIGVHKITKLGTGIAQVNNGNTGFAGDIVVEAGDLQAKVESALGSSGKITVKTNGKLTIDVSNAMDVNTALYTEGTAQLQLNQDITISEWYIDGVIQNIGQYDTNTNSSTISGSGKIIIGRPSEFTFLGGNWDVANNYSPALLPEAGEKVIVDGVTIEAQGNLFSGDMYVQNGGSIRLRNNTSNSKCLGPVTMYQGTNISYATSGTGFYLVADIILEGDISLLLNSSNTAGSVMDLPGTFSGNSKVTVRNTRDVTYTATAKLGGDNINFTGTWDLTVAAANAGGASAINGFVENAFGNGLIDLAVNNKAIFNHAKCAGDVLKMNIVGSATAVLNVAVIVKEFILNGTPLGNGTYNASTHSGLLSGTGSITVDSSLSIDDKVFLEYNILRVKGNLENLEIYNIMGQSVHQTNSTQEIDLKWLKSGIYIVRFKVDGKQGAVKFYKN
ncbi:pectinesterase family protein [Mariniflexile soesokkakense]|uniref:Pectinesterase family protein n=1 Tax=Mariniflexile soesokkakense TaxID=1343160 RepID=A0ABV0A730_9FLAO